MVDEQMMRVECGGCGWKGRRKSGKIVQCPKCGGIAAYQCEAGE